MNDITAVILSIGEETTQRAIDSVNRQTLLPKEIIVVKDVVPFHRALNSGAGKVQTDFFVQVDSDMILYDYCFEYLRNQMRENVGLAFGPLQDPLLGKIAGIKMFRKSCFEEFNFQNTISPDTDFYVDAINAGWQVFGVLKYPCESKAPFDTFGEHNPIYSPHYTFSKFVIAGGRRRYKRDLNRVKLTLKNLHKSNHCSALFAEIAMAHGVFATADEDWLKPFPANSNFDFLERFLIEADRPVFDELNVQEYFNPNQKIMFENFYRLGIDLRKELAATAFKKYLQTLHEMDEDISWVAKLGLCQGIFNEKFDSDKFARDYDLLEEISFKPGNSDEPGHYYKWRSPSVLLDGYVESSDSR